ncbi:TonB-dependent receptor plug domain-containing protein [Thioclava sp.]|uniref:TonB-dependent receptor plug domain-containing protein n=1 Tax=Thioclava sp. TaxID=1933450 RepID=UPI003AA9507B
MKTTQLTTALLLSTALATPALAQDSQPYALDEIVFSGALGSKPLNALTYGRSYTVVTADEIDRLGYATVTQALSSVPGVAVTQTDASLGSVFIRGGDSNMTVVLIDGVKASAGYNGAFYFNGLDVADIERIEVLRGPQSVIGGANAAAGVISITTKKASEPGLHQQTGIGYGSYGTTHVNYNAQYRGARGQIAFSIAQDHKGGYDISGDGGQRDSSTLSTGTITGQYDITDWLTAGVMLRQSYQNYDYDSATGSGSAAAYVVDADNVGKRRDTFGQLWFKADSLGGRLQHKLSYAGTDIGFKNYSSGVLGSSNSSQHRELNYTATYALDATTVEAARQTLAFAAQEETDHFSSDYGFGPSAYQRTTRSAALQYSGDFDNGLGLEAGVRRIFNDVFEDGTTWNIAASYQVPASAVRLHGSIGKAIVNPDMYEQFGFVPGVYSGNPNLRPETVRGIDVGAQYSFGERGNIDVTLFQQHVSDKISGYGTTSTNLPGTSKSYGVEISGQYQVTSNLLMSLDYTYTHARDASGDYLTRRPAHEANLAATYSFAQGRGAATLAIKHVSGNYDGQFFLPFPSPIAELPNYTLVNLSGSYALDNGVSLVGRIDNVTDENYSEAWGYASAGRTAYVGLRAAF